LSCPRTSVLSSTAHVAAPYFDTLGIGAFCCSGIVLQLQLATYKGSSLGGGSSNDDRVLHGIVLLEGLDELGDGGTLLTDGDIDTIELLAFVSAIVPAPLIEDGVNGDGGLAGLAVTDDELTLATTNGHHRVDRLEVGQHGLVDGTAGENGGGFDRGRAAFRRLDGTLAIDGVAEGVNDATKEGGANGDVDDLAVAFDGVACLDETIVTEDGNTDVVSS
jgi:hypothetical protein